jgi:hypothetical protein
MQIPKNNTLTIKNQHPICINVTYDKLNLRFKLDDPTFLVNGFDWFYGQPVKVYGIYTYIRNITAETTGGITNYFIFVKDDINALLSTLSSTNLQTQMIIICLHILIHLLSYWDISLSIFIEIPIV